MIRATYKGKKEDRYAEVQNPDGTTERVLVESHPTEFLAGIPARDLQEEEWQLLTNEQRADVRASPLYDVKTDSQIKGKDSE